MKKTVTRFRELRVKGQMHRALAVVTFGLFTLILSGLVLSIGPATSLPTSAHQDTTSPCTANDVTASGEFVSGSCPSCNPGDPVTADVRFFITNNTSTTRY